MPAERTERLVGFVVAGATRPPLPSFDCRSFILLPSDVQAACGPGLQLIAPFGGESEAGSCTYHYGRAQARLTVRAQVEPFGDDTSPEGAVAIDLDQGPIHARVTYTGDACSDEGAERLLPLLSQLLPHSSER